MDQVVSKIGIKRQTCGASDIFEYSQYKKNEPTPTQGYVVSMGNNLMIDSRVGAPG